MTKNKDVDVITEESSNDDSLDAASNTQTSKDNKQLKYVCKNCDHDFKSPSHLKRHEEKKNKCVKKEIPKHQNIKGCY